ncbi:FG-GAP-like repeat-containing protein [Psychroserpens sp. BH13MA-6]
MLRKVFSFFRILLIVGVVSVGHSQLQFSNVAINSGLNAVQGGTAYGNGVSFYDFDNDGWDDVTMTSAVNNQVRFYKNTNGVFTEVDFGLSFLNYQTRSATWVDYDSDGDNDLFVTSDTNGNKLLKNLGNMIFEDITLSTGMVTTNMFTFGASWGDYDNDGLLDLFLSNRTDTVTNKLYKNNGDDTFNDVTDQSGIDSNAAFSFCSVFFDMNNDGHQDLYVSNDKLSYANKLYKNNGDGTFTDISVSSGTDIMIDAMTVTVGDYNRDGYFDIYITNNPSGNVLYRNNGDETFQNVTSATGTIFNSIGWGANFFDADNDRDVDLYVSGQLDGSIPGLLSAAFYESVDGNFFGLNNGCFVGDTAESYSNAIGDFNNDGRIDVIVSNNNEELHLWQNETTPALNWIKVNLVGVQSNIKGVGAKIEISVNGQKDYRVLKCGEGYLAQNSSTEHFGLDASTLIDYIKVYWPSGMIDTYFGVLPNQVLTLHEGDTLSLTDTETHDVMVFPNPAESLLYIKANSEILNVTFFDVLGNELQVPKKASNIFDIAGLSSGTYVLSVSTGNRVENHQFLKR